jgi:hypothetical protein
LTSQITDFRQIRSAISAIPGDVSNDAVGSYVPKLEEIYAPEMHAAALDSATPIVVGPRGAGKSFWSGVLGQKETRLAAAKAYPKLKLETLNVEFGFTGLVSGSEGVGVDALDSNVPSNCGPDMAKSFWWATIIRAAQRAANEKKRSSWAELMKVAAQFEERGKILARYEKQFRLADITLLVVYDALDVMATSWPRRRMLTEALLEVVWAMRAYRHLRVKLFIRPDQIDDDALRFIELPKLQTGAVRLRWTREDLYGLLFSRLSSDMAFKRLLRKSDIPVGTSSTVLTRRWPPAHDAETQIKIMTLLSGTYMADGPNAYKKGKTYDWPVVHLSDAFEEVTPRSFLGMMISAAKFGTAPEHRALTPDGIRHGLRAASKTRVDQLHQEFQWIKGVLAPLAGLLLPQDEKEVYKAWRMAKTVPLLISDALLHKYLPPFSREMKGTEPDLFAALERIGVMFRRKDGRLDMPDLFRVAAKLLKKGGTAPL